MKVVLTEKEVEAIVLAHIQQFFPQANTVTINNYSSDFCRVTAEEKEPAVQIEQAA